jgi:predicted nucleic acid-binding protein
MALRVRVLQRGYERADLEIGGKHQRAGLGSACSLVCRAQFALARRDRTAARDLSEFAQRPRVRGPVIHDARVAALCLAHGVDKLISRDRDFSIFPELRIENPF